jgi:hypothetical protein
MHRHSRGSKTILDETSFDRVAMHRASLFLTDRLACYFAFNSIRGFSDRTSIFVLEDGGRRTPAQLTKDQSWLKDVFSESY